jgi:amidase
MISGATIADLGRALSTGEIRSSQLVAYYCERFDAHDRGGRALHSIIEINPEVEEIATRLDEERAAGHVRGPLHGIPILLKDNIDTHDRMETTAGSLALLGSRPRKDATVAARLRAAGVILFGKANLSEWANFRSEQSTSGWSARGGQCKNPYDTALTPCGSSSGSGVAVAADLVAGALGTETDGSILCPAAVSGIVGIKPTVGLTSRAGVIPISHTQDSVGPMTKTVEDAALLLSAIAGPDTGDPATGRAAGRVEADYTRFLDPDGLRGARLGVVRSIYFNHSAEVVHAIESAISQLQELGAVVIDPADIPTAEEQRDSDAEMEVLLYEFKANLNTYLASRPDAQVRTLEELIRFNEDRAADELPYFGQDLFERAQEKGPLTEPAYLKAKDESYRLSGPDGIDAALREHRLDALVMPSRGLPWPINHETGDQSTGPGSSGPPARAGYPAITVPAGFVGGLPIGLSFVGTAFSEPTLLRLAYAFEQATRHRRPPALP